MSEIQERIAYLQGLAEGYGLDEKRPEGQMILQVIGVLEQMARRMEDLAEEHEELEDYVGEIDDDLMDLEEEFSGEWPDEVEALEMDGLDDGEFDFDGDEDSESVELELECPACGARVALDWDDEDEEETLDLTCPDCGEVLGVRDAEEPGLVADSAPSRT